MFRSKRTIKMVAILVMALVLASITYAFAAANTMPATVYAGDGETTVAGYTISNVTFVHDASNPSQLTGVSFAVAPAVPVTVKIQLEVGGSWLDCSEAATTTCTFASNVPVEDVVKLRVLATSYSY